MAKVLSRPMFKRGGNVNSNSGIISGFEKGGNVRQKYAAGDYVQPNYSDILSNYITEPEQQTGLNSSDWLRIAAAGANIMGAPSTGRTGFIGALQAAGPSLSDLGTDLATSRDTRDQNYLTRKSAYDAAMGNAAIQAASDEAGFQRDRIKQEAQFTQDADLFDRRVDHEENILRQQQTHESAMVQVEIDAAQDLLRKQYELDQEYGKYDFAIQFQTEKSQEISEQMIKLEKEGKKGSDEWNLLKSQYENIIYGEAVNAIREGRVDLAKDDEFMRLVRSAYTAALDAAKNPESADYGKSPDEIYDSVIDQIFRGFGLEDLYIPGGNAAGGRPIRRRNFENGGMTSVAPTGTMNTAPVAAQPTDELQLSYEELRRRLPPEVSDQVIQLILNSEEAMIDFAQLQTPQDIGIFNQKYNTDLQMPTQVA